MHYAAAIGAVSSEPDPAVARALANRAQAHMKLNHWAEAIGDCNVFIAKYSSNELAKKVWLRRGIANFKLANNIWSSFVTNSFDSRMRNSQKWKECMKYYRSAMQSLCTASVKGFELEDDHMDMLFIAAHRIVSFRESSQAKNCILCWQHLSNTLKRLDQRS